MQRAANSIPAVRPLQSHADPAANFYRAMTLLTVASPCALVIGVPVGTHIDVPVLPGMVPAFFKVQVGAVTNAPAGLPENLRLSAQRQSNGSVRLTWNSVRGRGYRVEGSSAAAV